MTRRRGTARALAHALTKDWRFSTIFQVQSGYPMTISVFGDTANAGTALGENPIRANLTGQQIFSAGHTQYPPVVQSGVPSRPRLRTPSATWGAIPSMARGCRPSMRPSCGPFP